MGGAADEGVGCVGQGVEHVLADQPALSGLHQRLQQVVDHLGVHGPFGTKSRLVLFSCICHGIVRSTVVIISRVERGKGAFIKGGIPIFDTLVRRLHLKMS